MEIKDLNVTTEKTVLHVTEIHPKLLQKGIDLRYCQMFEFFLVNFDPNSGNVYALFCRWLIKDQTVEIFRFVS